MSVGIFFNLHEAQSLVADAWKILKDDIWEGTENLEKLFDYWSDKVNFDVGN